MIKKETSMKSQVSKFTGNVAINYEEDTKLLESKEALPVLENKKTSIRI